MDRFFLVGNNEHLLKVQDNVGDVFHNAFDALELVLNALDFDGGDRGAFNGTQENPAQAVSDSVSVAALEGFGDEFSVCVRGRLLILDETVGKLKFA
jgi:hypothetical protein